MTIPTARTNALQIYETALQLRLPLDDFQKCFPVSVACHPQHRIFDGGKRAHPRDALAKFGEYLEELYPLLRAADSGPSRNISQPYRQDLRKEGSSRSRAY